MRHKDRDGERFTVLEAIQKEMRLAVYVKILYCIYIF